MRSTAQQELNTESAEYWVPFLGTFTYRSAGCTPPTFKVAGVRGGGYCRLSAPPARVFQGAGAQRPALTALDGGSTWTRDFHATPSARDHLHARPLASSPRAASQPAPLRGPDVLLQDHDRRAAREPRIRLPVLEGLLVFPPPPPPPPLPVLLVLLIIGILVGQLQETLIRHGAPTMGTYPSTLQVGLKK